MIRFFATSLCSLMLLLPTLADAQIDLVASFATTGLTPVDELGVAIGAVHTAAAGETLAYRPSPVAGLHIRNSGTVAAGPFTFQIYLSKNTNRSITVVDPDANPDNKDGVDQLIHTQTISLGCATCGGESHEWKVNEGEGLSFRIQLPRTIDLDSLGTSEPYLKLILDPNQEVPETSELNVWPTSGKIKLVGPNISVGESGQDMEVVVDPPEAECYFGEPLSLKYKLCNIGERDAVGFLNVVVISKDDKFKVPAAFQGDEADSKVHVLPAECNTVEDAQACTARGGVCHNSSCQVFCADTTNHTDCPANLFCAVNRSLPFSAPPTCQNLLQKVGDRYDCWDYEVDVTIPTVDIFGQRFEESGFYLGVIANYKNPISEITEDDNATVAGPMLDCRYPRADLTPVSLIAPSRMAAGETATIVRRIANTGIVEGRASYRYVLSTNDFASHDDVTLPLESSIGGDGIVTVGRKSHVEGTDLVRVPSTVRPGEYYIGLVVDGAGALDELDETNNTFISSTRVVVEESVLRVVTRRFANATVNVPYNHQLVAAGGVATYRWTTDRLPQGFTFSSNGRLSGTPREPGDYVITVKVTSGDVSATAMLGIRVDHPMGSIAITTETLPPVIVEKPYTARIAAQGGKPFFTEDGKPYYRCRRLNGPLPLGIEEFVGDCTLSGTSRSVEGPREILIEVEDSIGNRATRWFSMSVVASSRLIIETQRLDEASAGVMYGTDCADFPAMTASGAPDGYEYHWSLEETAKHRKPGGLQFSSLTDNQGKNVGCLIGTPTECGDFLIPVRVTAVPAGMEPLPSHDSATALLPIHVVCTGADLGNIHLPSLERGESIDHQLVIEAGVGGRTRIFGGHLPAGITLSDDGLIHGTVAEDAQLGMYNFVVEVEDDEGGHGLVGLSLEIRPTIGPPPPPPPVEDPGCLSSASGSGLSGVLPFAVVLLGLMAAVFRRRVAACVRIGSIVAIVGLAGGAQAQLQAGYVVTAPLAMGYEELPPNATRAPSSYSDADYSSSSHMWRVSLPPQFKFRFFGVNYGYLGISGNGAIVPYSVPSPGTSVDYYVGISNLSFPNPGGSAGIIAPWWDDMARSSTLSRPGGLYHWVEGTQPNRVFKVQWKNLTHYNCLISGSSNSHCNEARAYSFQTWIYEADESGADSTIVFSYGTPIGPGDVPGAGRETPYTGSVAGSLPSASIGMENVAEDKGVTALACTPNCTFNANFPTEQAIVITQKPDIHTTSLTGDAAGWGGVRFDVRGEVRNVGWGGTGSFAVQFFGSLDAVLDDSDVVLGSSDPIGNVAAGATASFAKQVVLPQNVQQGSYYIIAKADHAGAVNEDLRTNNVAVHGPFVINHAAPDATVEAIDLPASAAIGSQFTLGWTARNLGNAPVRGMAYHVMLSTNALITPSDRKLGAGVVDVDALSTGREQVEVTVPADVRPGQYHLGILLDPANEIAEVDEQNNAFASAGVFSVVGGPLQILSAELPVAQLGANYCVEVLAAGGNGDYVFSVAQDGALPPGLALMRETAGATLLCGAPSTVGDFSFALQVQSGVETASATLSLIVTASTAPLTVVSAELPGALYNSPYDVRLFAVGGQAPYRWSLASGTLPRGLLLTSSGGIVGAATIAGAFPLTVKVEDSAGEVAFQALELSVAEPNRITCLATALPSTVVGNSLEFSLHAAGGNAPYFWTGLEVRRLAQGADRGESLKQSAPPGLALSRAGMISGIPATTGSYLWTVEVQDDNARQTCLLLLDVVYEQGLTVVTHALADAEPGVPYQVHLEASGGDNNQEWRLAPGSTFPAGMQMDRSGLIAGVLDASLLGADASRTFSFVVEVHDGLNRPGVAGLSITLRRPLAAPPIVDGGDGDGGGCQAGAGAPGIMGMALALGLALLRRRD